MKKHFRAFRNNYLAAIIGMLIAFSGSAQIKWGVKNYNYYPFNGIRIDSVIVFPDTSYSKAPDGSFAFQNHVPYYKDTIWKAFGAGGADGNNYPLSLAFSNNNLTLSILGKPSISAAWDSTLYHSIGYYDGRYLGKSVTYSVLNTLKTAKQLLKGQAYLITDFATTYKIYGTSTDAAGPTEQLLVTATSDSTISPIAYSPSHPEDIIYYSLTDNSVLAPSAGSKGVITYRADTRNNLSTYYDFRAVKWRRWSLVNGAIYYAFTGSTPAYNSSQYIDTLTFMGSAHDIHLGSATYNVTIETGCFDIKIGNGCGSPGAGIYISSNSYSINIDDECATVQTTGSGYIGGIYIGGLSRDIRIGSRSYNIQIGSNCYALDLGVQNSDVFVPDNTFRRRLEKGFSNFEVTVPLSAKTIDLYNTQIDVLSPYLYGNANYCGIIYVTSANATDTLEKLSSLTTSVNWSDKTIIPEIGLNLLVRDKSDASTSGSNIDMGGDSLVLNGTKNQEAVFHKRMIDGTGAQPDDFYLSYTNTALSTGSAAIDTVNVISNQYSSAENKNFWIQNNGRVDNFLGVNASQYTTEKFRVNGDSRLEGFVNILNGNLTVMNPAAYDGGRVHVEDDQGKIGVFGITLGGMVAGTESQNSFDLIAGNTTVIHLVNGDKSPFFPQIFSTTPEVTFNGQVKTLGIDEIGRVGHHNFWPQYKDSINNNPPRFYLDKMMYALYDPTDSTKLDTLGVYHVKISPSGSGIIDTTDYNKFDSAYNFIAEAKDSINALRADIGTGGGGGGTTTNALSIATELHSGGATTFNGSSAVSIGIQSGSVTNTMLAGSIDAAKINTGVVSNTEFNYLDGVTSAIQTQLNGKQGTLTLTTTGTSGAATLVGNTLNIPQYSGGGFTLSGRATDFSNKAVLLYDTVATTYSYADILLAKLNNIQNNDFVIDSSGYWVNRTPSAVKTVLSLNNVENTALSTWAGTSNITTLGTITTGVWHGTALTSTYLPSSVVYNTGSYADPSWITSLSGTKVLPSYTGNDGKVLGLVAGALSWVSSGGTGTVTTFSSGNLSPLFTTSVSNATSTPALSFTLSSAAAHTFFGNNTGSSAAPTYFTLAAADIPNLDASKITTGTKTSSFISDFTTAVQTVGDARYLQSYTETDPKRVTSAAFSGSATKTLTLTLADASTVTASFSDSVGTGGGGVSFGTTTQIPYMNTGGTDFLYSSNLVFDGTNLAVGGKVSANSTQVVYVPDQTNYTGTIIFGNGGLNLSHSGTNDGRYNTFIGIGAGNANTTGYSNMAQGYNALLLNTTGVQNTAVGRDALHSNTTGTNNSAISSLALFSNTTGGNNIAIGPQTLYLNNTGNYNNALGVQSLYQLSSGSENFAGGYQAGTYIANGTTYNATANQGIYIGNKTKASASGNTNETVIGYNTIGHGSNTVTIGNTNVTGNYFIGSLYLTTPPSGNTNDSVLVYRASDSSVRKIASSLLSGGGSMVYPGAGIPVSTGSAWGTSITNNSTNWNTAYTDRMKWDGGSTGLTASTGRTSLGATTVGSNLFTLTNPSAITFLRVNADNTVSALDAATFRTAIGAGTSSTNGTVTTFSAGDLSPLFTTSTATNTTTPALGFTLSNAAAHTFFGNNTGSSAAPTYFTLSASDIPNISESQVTNLTSDLAAKQGTITLTTTGTSGAATFSSNTLNIPNYTYTLPTASTSTLGGVKVDGTTITITGGVISTAGSGTISSGTTNNIPKYTASTTLGASSIWDVSGKVGINQGTPLAASSLTIKGQGTSSTTTFSLYTTDASGTLTSSLDDKGNLTIAGALKGAIFTIDAPSGDYTIPAGNYFFKLLDLTAVAANKTVTFPDPSSYTGQEIRIINNNGSGTYHWLVSGTVQDGSGSNITQLTNGASYTFISNGTAWIKAN